MKRTKLIVFILYAVVVIGFVAYNILMNGIPEY